MSFLVTTNAEGSLNSWYMRDRASLVTRVMDCHAKKVGSFRGLCILSKALYHACFICGQSCKWWSHRPKLTSSVISDVTPIIYIFTRLGMNIITCLFVLYLKFLVNINLGSKIHSLFIWSGGGGGQSHISQVYVNQPITFWGHPY